MDFFTNIWKNIESLKNLSGYLNWFSISLIFFGGFLQIAKHIVDRREKNLSELLQLEKDSIKSIQEVELKNKVDNLKGELGDKLKEVDELKEKAKFTNPYEQPIHSGSSTVEVVIQSDKEINTNFMDQGGYIAFGVKGKPIMVMASTSCIGVTTGKNQVTYRGVFNLDAADVAIGKIINTLKETEFVQIGFKPMPEQSLILDGKAICTINGIVRFEMKIPQQTMAKDFMIISNLKEVFNSFK